MRQSSLVCEQGILQKLVCGNTLLHYMKADESAACCNSITSDNDTVLVPGYMPLPGVACQSHTACQAASVSAMPAEAADECIDLTANAMLPAWYCEGRDSSVPS